MKTMANQEIRQEAKRVSVPFWAIADALAISEPTITRMLRRELPDEDRERVLAAIERLAADRMEVGS